MYGDDVILMVSNFIIDEIKKKEILIIRFFLIVW